MNLSEVDIANMALGYIGRAPIQSFEEKSNEAVQAKLHYPLAVNEVLRAAPWPDAKAFAMLTVYDDSVALPTGWAYAYAWPSDCVTARYLNAEGNRHPRFERFLNPDTNQRMILTNEFPAQLVYTTDRITPESFSPDMANAIAWKLAEKLSLAITRTQQRLTAAQEGYRSALSAARTSAANEEPDYGSEWDAPWIAERLGGYPPPRM